MKPEKDAMSVTYYVALPFVPTEDGLAAGQAQECPNENAAIRKAEFAEAAERWRARVQAHRRPELGKLRGRNRVEELWRGAQKSG